MQSFRIGYSSNAGNAEIYTDISDSDIDRLYKEMECFPIESEDVERILPDLHKRILNECQQQEDSCLRSGIYDVEEYEDMEPEDFIVTNYYIFD